MGIFRITASQKMAQKPPTAASYPVTGPKILLEDDLDFARAADAQAVPAAVGWAHIAALHHIYGARHQWAPNA